MTEAEVKNLAPSVKARLPNLAHPQKEDFQELLSRYGRERLLYRLSLSEFSGSLASPGSISESGVLQDSSDAAFERIAVHAAPAFEETRGCRVESFESDTRGLI